MAILLGLSAAPILAATSPPKVVLDDGALVVQASFAVPGFHPAASGGESVVMEGLEVFATEPGSPRLPVATMTLVLPPGTTVGKISAEGPVERIPGTHRLAWGQPPVPIGTAPRTIPPNPSVYASSDLYPATPVRLAGEGLFRGYHLATVEVWPLQLRPARGEVLLRRSITLRLELNPAKASTAGALGPRGLPEDIAELAHLAVNPEAAKDYPAPKASDATEPYMIICPESLKASFQRLLDHRQAHGMPGRIMTTEWILDHYSGVDNAEKVRAAIREAYTQRGTDFVLLGGDDVDDSGALLVPYRGCLLDAGGYRYEDAPVDYYFGALDGTWNSDGDDVWCEPDEIDYFTEVHIGRATVDTPAEADRFIDKVLAYEAGLPDERRRDLVWMGESLDSSTWGGDSKDVTAGLIDENEYDITRLYEREGTFSHSAVIENLNRGPHLTNHLGHANDGYVMGIYRSDVDGLTNETPFFSYSQGCDSGAWDQNFSGNSEAISEHFLTAEHAAFGVVMNARYGWYDSGSTEGPSQFLDNEFYDALFTEGLRTLGEANDDSRHDNAAVAQTDPYRRWCFLETNLHGDPATPVQVGAKLRVASVRVIDDDPLYGNANGIADPSETVRLAVTLENTTDQQATNVEAFLTPVTDGLTIHDGWAAWDTIPGREEMENLPPHFSATFDLSCGAYGSFSIEIHFDDGKVATDSFSILVGERTHEVLFADDFESDQGWSVGGTCTDGDWVRDAPNGTYDLDKPANPSEDASPDPGTLCYVTGNDGVTADDDDVDGGTAVLTSPQLDATGWLDLELSYSRWFYVAPMTIPPSDTLRVEVTDDGGENWQLLEEVLNPENSWTAEHFPLESLLNLGPGIMLRLTAEDRPGAHRDVIVEAGLDEVRFEGTRAECHDYTPGTLSPPHPVGNTLLVSRYTDSVRLDWDACDGDATHDPATFYRVDRNTSREDPWQTQAETCAPCYVDENAALAGDYYQYLVAARNGGGDETP